MQGSQAGRLGRQHEVGATGGGPRLGDHPGVVVGRPLLLERPDESLRDSVPLRLSDEGGRGLDAQESELVLVVPADELAAVVVAELEADRDLGIIGAEDPAHALPDRLQSFEAIAPAGGP